MEHHTFRILGLDTSFNASEQVHDAEMPRKQTGSNAQQPRLAPGTQGQASMNEQKVTVRLVDLLPLLIDATQKNRAWIKDFGNDNVTISQDLYEVALAYRSMGRAA